MLLCRQERQNETTRDSVASLPAGFRCLFFVGIIFNSCRALTALSQEAVVPWLSEVYRFRS
jgi:hypothetical protein